MHACRGGRRRIVITGILFCMYVSLYSQYVFCGCGLPSRERCVHCAWQGETHNLYGDGEVTELHGDGEVPQLIW